jgi:hypothetical protein
MFYVLDRIVKKTKDVKQIINELNECGAYCNGRGDCLHAGFFFTLSDMLALKHEVRMLPGEAIERKDFEDSWRKTRQELGI